MPNLPPELSPEKRMSHLDELFRTLDPERLGAGYAAARRAQDVEESIRQVARHFRSRPRRLPDDDPGFLCYDADRAERAVRGEVEVVNISWKFPDGRIDFLFDPTAIHGPVNHEWVWQLNRHGYWGDMARAFAAGGDGRYARQFNIQLRDWIARTDCPADWNAPGSAWRTIETGLRLMGAWPVAFEFFRCSPFFTDENLCLMLASMHRQAVHLASHPTSGNWLLMEMNGLYTFATLFPEFRTAAGFRELSARTLSGALRGQLLPDGMHDELSPDYHSVVFRCGCAMYRLAGLYHQAGELPPDFRPLLEKAAEAALALAAPGLTQPRTNDCFTLRTDVVLGKAVSLFPERMDFLWAATGRLRGTPPAGETASRFLPWAGFAAMRSDWGPEASFLCFDVGPRGMGHQHQDKLNINLYKGAEELIFDDITTGASQDIKQATATARSMITKYGMSENLGLVAYDSDSDEVFIGRDDEVCRKLAEEAGVERIVEEVPEGVEVTMRKQKDGTRYVFVQNFNREAVAVKLPIERYPVWQGTYDGTIGSWKTIVLKGR